MTNKICLLLKIEKIEKHDNIIFMDQKQKIIKIDPDKKENTILIKYLFVKFMLAMFYYSFKKHENVIHIEFYYYILNHTLLYSFCDFDFLSKNENVFHFGSIMFRYTLDLFEFDEDFHFIGNIILVKKIFLNYKMNP